MQHIRLIFATIFIHYIVQIVQMKAIQCGCDLKYSSFSIKTATKFHCVRHSCVKSPTNVRSMIFPRLLTLCINHTDSYAWLIAQLRHRSNYSWSARSVSQKLMTNADIKWTTRPAPKITQLMYTTNGLTTQQINSFLISSDFRFPHSSQACFQVSACLYNTRILYI